MFILGKDVTFHTDNQIQSYLNQLQSYYFGLTRNTRGVRMIYIFISCIIIYRQDSVRLQFYAKKERAESIDDDKSIYMATENMNTVNCLI